MQLQLTGPIQLRHDTAANWAAKNPTLLAGELGHEDDTGRFKFGNGGSAWNDLVYTRTLEAENVVPVLVDGTTDTYELPQAPNPPSSLRVYNGGERMTLNVDYTLTGNRYQYLPEQAARGNQVADYRY